LLTFNSSNKKNESTDRLIRQQDRDKTDLGET
jgi:hypothetical protein